MSSLMVVGHPVTWENNTYYSDEDLWTIVNKSVWRGVQLAKKHGEYPHRLIKGLRFDMRNGRRALSSTPYNDVCHVNVTQRSPDTNVCEVRLYRASQYTMSALDALASCSDDTLSPSVSMSLCMSIGSCVLMDALGPPMGPGGRHGVLMKEEEYLAKKGKIMSWRDKMMLNPEDPNIATTAFNYHIPDCLGGIRVRYYRTVRHRKLQTKVWREANPDLWLE